MDDKQKPEEMESKDEQKEWETPELIVEDVDAVTQGGPIGDLNPPDDAFYT